MLKDCIRRQKILNLSHMAGDISDFVANCVAKRLLHVVEVRSQIVYAEGPAEVRLVAPCEELGHVADVAQPVVDGSCGQHVERLQSGRVPEKLIELVVTRRIALVVAVALAPRITEVVSLIDDHDIGELGDPTEPLGEVPFATQVRMAEDSEVAEVGVAADATDV
ncbi:MAG: hypothetical protein ACREXX_00485, partial [Gammaproteobacteria bacterium]